MSDVQAMLSSRFGKKIPGNTVLFQEGDRGEDMYMVQPGKVKAGKRIRGVEKTLASAREGRVLRGDGVTTGNS